MKKNKWLIPKPVVTFIAGFAIAWMCAPYQPDMDTVMNKVEVKVEIRPFDIEAPCTVRMYYGGEEYIHYCSLVWK